MAMQIGIVGLPNVGKSTLFNALTSSKGAEAANYPFCTIEPNVGIVEVRDPRINAIAEIVKPEKVIPAAIEFVDIAGLVKGASKGEGLGNKFLASIREVNAICHVVRSFEDKDITHVDGSVDPKRDKETIETELILSDLEAVQKRIEKSAGNARSGDKDKIAEIEILKKIEASLNEGKPAVKTDLSDKERIIAKSFFLLTNKPIVYAVNIAEESLADFDAEQLKAEMGLDATDQLVAVSAKIEQDLHDLSQEEAAEYLKDLGVDSSGLDNLIRASYAALGYETYFTAGVKEVRAWTITKGMTAPQAAGVIHTDFEKGFIRAETIAYNDFIAHNGEHGAKEAGKMRQEGKDYVVKDGDIMLFKFNV